MGYQLLSSSSHLCSRNHPYALWPPHPHLFPTPSHQQEGHKLPSGVQCVFHPKLLLINWVELQLNTSSKVKYRFCLLAGDGLAVHSVDRESKLISRALAWHLRPNGHVVFCCTQERKLFPLICLFQGWCLGDDRELSLGNEYMAV